MAGLARQSGSLVKMPYLRDSRNTVHERGAYSSENSQRQARP